MQLQSASKIAVNFLTHQAQIPWRLEYIHRECFGLLGSYGIGHIFREGNRVADNLTNEAHIHKSLLCYDCMEELPVEVVNKITQDVHGFYSYRV